ncbi:hypothetical protein D1AOALGA4SA_7128 [Olavius algarvensis Delta 1 endosymbiont]|nr:hypothetical protein D1AOALGA4SA_7128 [Olavius algarvensis Delta 1 endosymbiont]
MFKDLMKVLEQHNYGVRAYEHFSQMCYQSAKDQPDHAVFFLTLSILADRFVNQYDESPLTTTAADAQKDEILAIIASMEESVSSSAADQINVLNTVSMHIMGH